jgi:transposase-like protein
MATFKTSKGRKGQKGRSPKYDTCFKRQVAQEYHSSGQSLKQLGQRYDIPHVYVSRWAKQFSCELAEVITEQDMNSQEKKDMGELHKQLQALKKQLEYEKLKNFALETMVDLAKEELGIDLRKNSGAKQPGK